MAVAFALPINTARKPVVHAVALQLAPIKMDPPAMAILAVAEQQLVQVPNRIAMRREAFVRQRPMFNLLLPEWNPVLALQWVVSPLPILFYAKSTVTFSSKETTIATGTMFKQPLQKVHPQVVLVEILVVRVWVVVCRMVDCDSIPISTAILRARVLFLVFVKCRPFPAVILMEVNKVRVVHVFVVLLLRSALRVEECFVMQELMTEVALVVQSV